MPQPHEPSRTNLESALRAHEACDALRQRWAREQAEKNWPAEALQLTTRIGLDTGPAVVGNMGSSVRFNYTMMGDTVNLAARMESGAKQYGVVTMVTEAVVEGSRAVAPDAILFRPLDRIIVKGRSKPVTVYEVVDFADQASEQKQTCVAIYNKGLEAYFRGNWEAATAAFRESADLEWNAPLNPSTLMLSRVDALAKHTFPADKPWDGVYKLTSK